MKKRSVFGVILFVLLLVQQHLAFAAVCTQYRYSASCGSTSYTSWNVSLANGPAAEYFGLYNGCATNTIKYASWSCASATSCTFVRTNGAQFTYGPDQTRTGDYCNNSCSVGVTVPIKLTLGHGWIKGYTSDGRAMTEIVSWADMGNGPGHPPNTVCRGGCEHAIDGGASKYWVQTTPGITGMHAYGSDQNFKTTGNPCQGADASQPPATPPSCPGQLGQINGVTVCLKSGGATGSSVPDVSPTSTITPTGTETGTLGPNGELPGKDGDTKDGTAGGSSPGGGSVGGTEGGTSTTPDTGTGTTTTWGDITPGNEPAVPLLYERTYKKGPAEYFVTEMSTATGTLTAAIGTFFPAWTDNAGACPQFTIPLSLGVWDFGQQSPNIPCEVWTMCRWVVIISALFLARALIFGG